MRDYHGIIFAYHARPELRELVKDCYYSDCTHDETEVGCAVHKAVEEGRVSRERYESYLRMRFGDEEEAAG